MAAINIAFEVPQSPTFSVDEFRRKMTSYAKRLVITLSSKESIGTCKPNPKGADFENLSPEIQSLVGIVPEFTEDELNEDERLRYILEH